MKKYVMTLFLVISFLSAERLNAQPGFYGLAEFVEVSASEEGFNINYRLDVEFSSKVTLEALQNFNPLSGLSQQPGVSVSIGKFYDLEYWNAIRFRITVNGRTISNTFGRQPANSAFDAYNGAVGELSDWLEANLESLLTGSLVPTEAPSNPIALQNIQVFRNQVFSNKAVPKASRESKAGQAPKSGETSDGGQVSNLTLIQMSQRQFTDADLGYDMFSISSIDGSSLNISGGYGKTSADEKWTYGGNAIVSSLSLDVPNAESKASYSVAGFLNRSLYKDEKADSYDDAYVGASVNYLSDGWSDINFFGAALFGIFTRTFSDGKVINAGVMYNFANGDKNMLNFLNAAGSYGFPVGEQLAFNIEAILTHTMASYDGTSLELKSPTTLNLGVTGLYSFSPAFNLNVGLRKALLIEDYSNLEIRVGSRWRF